MTTILLSGCNGRMGRAIIALCQNEPELEIIAGFDVLGQSGEAFPVFSNPAQCELTADVLVDFSNPAALDGLLAYGRRTHTPLVLCTTGYTPEQLAQIDRASEALPVFRSANMSLGINVLMELVKKAAAVLGSDYDVEIVERHHSKKLDAPSGTALMLADSAASALPQGTRYIYERHSVRQARTKQEIGISSVRGGTIVGDHTVVFAGPDEVIELSHHAASREVFAHGALQAAKFLAGVKKPGLYDMSHLIGAEKGS